MNKFYITTSIAYTNAYPHIGFALEAVQADVVARYHRDLGQDVLFLTGTDEHGQKISKAAELAKKEPKEFTDAISEKFRLLAKNLNLSNGDFIRTTDQKRHWPAVQAFWLKLKENGDIYKKQYQGLYCVGCEAFITKKDLVDRKCKIHQKEPEPVEEENYFFKLSKYSKEIGRIIKTDEVKIIPGGKKNEMLSFASQGLEDVSFSRPRKDLAWGIPVPDDYSQTIYVWADALVNYLSALDYPAGGKFKKYWPPDIHFLGKDILRFHATIWLGMLLSLKLELPKNIFVHGFITSAGQKISKSLGNVIDPFGFIEKYGADAVRYFLLREIPATEDGDFTEEKFIKRYNADLAGGIGNLVARVVTLAEKFKIPAFAEASTSAKASADKSMGKQNSKIEEEIKKIKKSYEESLKNFKLNEALIAVWELISFCDKYINDEKPWSLDATDDKEKLNEVIGDLLLTLGEIAGLLKPFLPQTSEKILKQLQVLKNEPLFPRFN